MTMNRIYCMYILGVGMLLFTTCKKSPDASPSAQTTFVREIDNGKYTYNTDYITCLPDGGFLSVGYNNLPGGFNICTMLRFNKTGSIVWQRTVPGDTTYPFYVLPKDDGTFIISEYSSFGISVIDTMGHLLSTSAYASGIDVYTQSGLYQTPAGYMLSVSDGNANAITDMAIVELDKNLKYTANIPLTDAKYFTGKTLYLEAYQENTAGTYYVYGQKFLNQNWNWGDIRKLFVAKVTPGQKAKETIIDSATLSGFEYQIWQIVNPDSSIVLLSSQRNYTTNALSTFLAKVDKNLKIVWQRAYPEENENINPYIFSKCKDGGFLISGEADNGTNNQKPYALKVDADGNKVWSKTYSFPGLGSFNFGTDCPDGGYFFVGSETGFGNEKGNQIMAVHTDASGNY